MSRINLPLQTPETYWAARNRVPSPVSRKEMSNLGRLARAGEPALLALVGMSWPLTPAFHAALQLRARKIWGARPEDIRLRGIDPGTGAGIFRGVLPGGVPVWFTSLANGRTAAPLQETP